MSVPVYLFTGFLDSGKTSFLQDTLRDPQFNDGSKTLVIVCEDGEVEYDEVVLAAYNASIVYVKEEADLTYEFLVQCQHTFHPDQVMIEFNGMWSVTNFMDVEYPIDWLLVQILTTVDASTFAMYMNNMRSIIFDQLVHSELIIFNRCSEDTKKSFLRANVKAINKGAQIIYETIDGQVNSLKDDELPFDVSGSSFSISADDYGLWYMDTLDKPKFYAGKTVTFQGQIVEVDYAHGDTFLIGREAMVCCAEDIQMIGFVVKYQDCTNLKRGMWVELQARMACEYDEEYGGDVPVMYAQQVTPCDTLEDLVTFS